MLRQMRHDVWANEKLLAHLRTLSDAQLALTAPGTFGSIRRTFQHIVGADEGYLHKLGIVMPSPQWPDEKDMPLAQTASCLALVKAGVEELFARGEPDGDGLVDDDKRKDPKDPPLQLEAWLLLAQFSHHGSDHRAQIATILGAHGLPTPSLDVWSYAWGIGGIKEKR